MKASERAEFLRAAWWVRVAEGIDARRLFFVDECGTHTSLDSIYGWARKDERLSKKVPRNKGKNTTLLASITYGGVGRCLAVEGATTKAVFQTRLERVLGPALSPEQVVMDNLAAHKGEGVRELIEARAYEMLYLTPYFERAVRRSK